jgi:hypothetical protein
VMIVASVSRIPRSGSPLSVDDLVKPVELVA